MFERKDIDGKRQRRYEAQHEKIWRWSKTTHGRHASCADGRRFRPLGDVFEFVSSLYGRTGGIAGPGGNLQACEAAVRVESRADYRTMRNESFE